MSRLSFHASLALVLSLTGCFEYYGAPGGGAGGGGGTSSTITVTSRKNPVAGEPTYVVKAPAGSLEISLATPQRLERVTFRPRTGSVVTTHFSTQADAFGDLGSPELIHDETTGATVRIVATSASRVEFHHFDRDGRWLSAMALYQEGTRFKRARVTGAPAFSGQLQGQLASGTGSGSFAVIGQASATETDVTDVTVELEAFSAALDSIGVTQQPLSGVKTQPLGSLGKFLKSAGTLVVGAALVAGALGAAPGVVGAYAAAGVCMVAAGYFSNDIANFVEQGFRSDDPFAQSMVDTVVTSLRNPDDGRSFGGTLSSIVDAVKRVKDTGRAVVTGAVDAVGALTTTSSWPSTPWTTPPAAPLPSSFDNPPTTSTSVTGQAVFQDNQTAQLTGTVDSNGRLNVSGTTTNGSGLTVTGTVTATSANGTFTRGTQSGTFTGTVVPVGECMVSQGSGGQGTFTNVHSVGAGTGPVSFNFDAFSIPDAVTVTAGGRTLFTTGGLVSGVRTATMQLMGEGVVFVSVSAPQSGTSWTYEVGCVP